jgi:hypothetical protein
LKQLKALKKKLRKNPDPEEEVTPPKQIHEGSSNIIPSLKQA